MSQNLLSCHEVRASFSEYLDGVTNGQTMQQVATHLRDCPACHAEFAGWRTVQDSLFTLRKPPIPIDLGLKLRLAISRERARQTTSLLDILTVKWENALRPMLVQVSAGFAMAVALLGTVAFLLGSVAVPSAVMANDEPLAAITAPRYLYSAEHSRPILTAHDATIVVEADVNAQGRVFDYTIISGPGSNTDAEASAVRTQVEDQLLLSVFAPARVFGSPVRGRVVMTYSGVSVHG